jgi:hypothetical protein
LTNISTSAHFNSNVRAIVIMPHVYVARPPRRLEHDGPSGLPVTTPFRRLLDIQVDVVRRAVEVVDNDLRLRVGE